MRNPSPTTLSRVCRALWVWKLPMRNPSSSMIPRTPVSGSVWKLPMRNPSDRLAPERWRLNGVWKLPMRNPSPVWRDQRPILKRLVWKLPMRNPSCRLSLVNSWPLSSLEATYEESKRRHPPLGGLLASGLEATYEESKQGLGGLRRDLRPAFGSYL